MKKKTVKIIAKCETKQKYLLATHILNTLDSALRRTLANDKKQTKYFYFKQISLRFQCAQR